MWLGVWAGAMHNHSSITGLARVGMMCFNHIALEEKFAGKVSVVCACLSTSLHEQRAELGEGTGLRPCLCEVRHEHIKSVEDGR